MYLNIFDSLLKQVKLKSKLSCYLMLIKYWWCTEDMM